LESRPRTEGADFGICQAFAASPAEPGELPCWLGGFRVTISGVFAVMLSAQAAKGAAQLQSETTYTVAADPYLPIQVIEPAY
jgi:hypothetical protein